MRFAVGYQPLPNWIDAIVENSTSVAEAYFSFGKMPSGRMAIADKALRWFDARGVDAVMVPDEPRRRDCPSRRVDGRLPCWLSM